MARLVVVGDVAILDFREGGIEVAATVVEVGFILCSMV